MNQHFRKLWNQGLVYELEFWEEYLFTHGLEWKDDYEMRMDPKSPLQEKLILDRIKEIPYDSVSILDVGAGPMTVMGKVLPGKTINITAIDPLADEFNRLLKNINVTPPVRTIQCKGEELLYNFDAQSFDFAFARNSIDNSYDPILIIKSMFTLVKKNRWVILKHRINYGKQSNYQGLYQWNFYIENNECILWNDEFKYNLSKIFSDYAQVGYYYDGEWVICTIKKLVENYTPEEIKNYDKKDSVSLTTRSTFDAPVKTEKEPKQNRFMESIRTIFSTKKRQSSLLKTKKLFCPKPFKSFEVFSWKEIGEVHMCCPGWLEMSIGNLQRQSIDEIWNSLNAHKIRRSILDGSFKYCNRDLCPYLKTVTWPVLRYRDIKDKELKKVIENEWTILPYGPRAINCSYDKSCNLYCPSCRTRIIIDIEQKNQILKIQNQIQNEVLRDAHHLYISGTGDPFGSPFYRKWLQTMNKKDMPNLKEIFLQTNGQLWTKKMWDTIPKDIRKLVKITEISIDAASPETYAINRRGGDFEKLLENLKFISKLRKRGPIKTMRISMVVQENNFLEMPDFVRLGKQLKVDTVFFNQLVNWGTYSDEEFSSRAIHLSEHPRHAEFIELLKNPIFKDQVVNLGNLTAVEKRKKNIYKVFLKNLTFLG